MLDSHVARFLIVLFQYPLNLYSNIHQFTGLANSSNARSSVPGGSSGLRPLHRGRQVRQAGLGADICSERCEEAARQTERDVTVLVDPPTKSAIAHAAQTIFARWPVLPEWRLPATHHHFLCWAWDESRAREGGRDPSL
eukprot:760254-Hanusia_phi.AAC.2